MKDNIIKIKSFEFAVLVVNTSRNLIETNREFILSKQFLRAGTSVGAMIRESEHAESRADFIHKLAIAQKEINESIYWIELLQVTEYLNAELAEELKARAVELIKLLTAILKTTKANFIK